MHYQVRVDIRGERPVRVVPMSVAMTMERHLEEVAERVRDSTTSSSQSSFRRFGSRRVASPVTYSADHARRSVVVMNLERVAELAG